MDLSKIGVLGFLDALSSAETIRFARNVERCGYSVLWVPELMGREIFSLSTHILSGKLN